MEADPQLIRERAEVVFKLLIPLSQAFQETLVSILAHSSFRYVLHVGAIQHRTVTFHSKWCRQPTPRDPVPLIRVGIDFRVTVRKSENRLPIITFRCEHEDFEHESLDVLDATILRLLKQKELVYERSVRHTAVPEYFATRLQRPEDASHKSDPSDIMELLQQFKSDVHAAEELLSQDDLHTLCAAAHLEVSSSTADATVSLTSLRDRFIERFLSFDTNDDRALDRNEFSAFLSDCLLMLTSQEIDACFAVADTNLDGLVDAQEFQDFSIHVLYRLLRHQKRQRRGLEHTITSTEHQRQQHPTARMVF